MTVLRWIKRLVLLLVLLAAVVLLGGPFFLSSEFGRTRVESALARALQRDVALGDLDVGLFFRSLEAGDVSMGHPEGFPEGKTVAIRSMRIDCGLLDLLEGRVKGRVVGTGVDLAVLKKGGRTTLDGLGGEGKEEGAGRRPPLDLEIDLEECDFTYRDLDRKETTSFEGIAVHAHLSDADETGRIKVTMRELRREPVVVREIELALRAKGSAVVIDSARGRMAGGGLLTAKGEFDLGEAGAWTARLDAERVSLDGSLVPVVATFWPFASSAGGHLQGLVTAGFDLKGKGVTWESVKPSMTGSGEIRLTQLQLPRESVLGQVAHFFDQGGAAGLGLNDAGAQFSIDQGWVSFNRLSASGEKARYDLAGRVSLEGKLDLRIDLLPIAKAFGESTYRDIAKHMDELIVNVRGTTTKPSLAMPDMEALLKKVAEDALSNEIKKALDRLR